MSRVFRFVNHDDRIDKPLPPIVVSKAIEEDDNVHRSNDLNGSKVSKPLDFIEVSDPKVAKAGDIVRIMHDAKEEEGLFYWLEGRILQRVMKASRAKHLKYAKNYFNTGKLRVISVWGKETKPLPSSVCTNLAHNLGWTI